MLQWIEAAIYVFIFVSVYFNLQSFDDSEPVNFSGHQSTERVTRILSVAEVVVGRQSMYIYCPQ